MRLKTAIKNFFTNCDRVLLQSASGITKYDRSLLQNASSIRKCDKLLLQSASGTAKCDSYYKVRSNTSDAITEPLFTIFKCCSKCEIFPDYWKKRNIVPVFKSDKQNIENCRPVSLLPI